MTGTWYESHHGRRLHYVVRAPGIAACGMHIGHPLSFVSAPKDEDKCKACLREMAKRAPKEAS